MSDDDVAMWVAHELSEVLDDNSGLYPAGVEIIAAALAAEREKARAPFLALADELDREGRDEEQQAIRYGKATTAESWWGSSAASLDAANRIRRAAEDPQ